MHDLNKYFLQYIMNNGIIKYNDGDSILRNIAEKINEEPKPFNRVVSQINEVLSNQLLQLDIKVCEITGEKMCVLINKSIDDISFSVANHTTAELELFESIITAIMTSDAKYISSIICLNLTNRLKAHISKDQAQDKIDFWMKRGYLAKKGGNIFFGARTISEFEMFLKGKFADRMTTCKLCTDFVYYGKICSECNEVLHDHCSFKYVTQTSNCPLCKKPWQEAEGRIYDEENSNDEQDVDTQQENDSDESMEY